MAISQITDHTAQALDRLPQQHRDKANLVALLTILAAPTQAIEDALWQLYVEDFNPEDGTGIALDRVGEIVGQPRNSLDDETYRRYLRAKILTNRSNGVTEILIRIARLIIFDDDARIRVQAFYPASLEMHVHDIALDSDIADVVISFLRSAKAAGVKVIEVFSEVAPASEFLFADALPVDDTIPELDTAHGFGNTTTPTTGGFFASALE